MDKISIIIPVFNTKRYLKECFDSVKKQTYTNLEILFVNDGSTDGSLEIIKSFEKEDKRVVVINQENKGLSAARNAGVKKSTGKYLMFLDSDDFLAEDAVLYLYGMIDEKQDTCISVCSHIEYYDKKKQKDFNSGGHKDKILSIEKGLNYMLNEKGFNLQSTAKLYRRDLFDGVLFPEGMLHEDVGTTYKLFLNAFKKNKDSKVSYGPGAKYYYRMREGSIIKKRFDEKRMDLVNLTDTMCDEIDAVFGALKNTTQLRRLHARFSILRMLAISGKLTSHEKEIWKEQRRYVLEHRGWIKGNSEATKRDRLAFSALRMGRTFFKVAWKIYEDFSKTSLS